METNLKRVHDAMEELDDEKRRYFGLDDGQEEHLVAVDVDQIIMRSIDHGRHVFWVRTLGLTTNRRR